MTTPDMNIDDFARMSGTSVRNVRAYLERGLLHQPRIVGRAGMYDDTHLDRMAVIQRLQREGFSLAGIRALLDAWQSGDSLERLLGAETILGATRSGVVDASTLFPLTKFQRPSRRAEHVVRSRCLTRLDSDGARHVLISAPGGSGKSTLAAQLLEAATGPTAWVSLEAADAEPGRFWTAVLIGLRAALPDFGDDLLGEIVGGGDVDRILVEVARRLGDQHPAIVIVFDDLHEVVEPNLSRQMEWFLEHTSTANCRMIMCARTRTPFNTARLVMSGQLSHLTTEDVGFDDAEARELLVERLGVSLGDADVYEIRNRTDGWAAGLYIAGVSMRSGMSLDMLKTSLAEPDRQVQRYLAEEMLDALDSQQVEFLEQVSLLGRFTADLCDAVRGRSDSAAHLDELANNMLVTHLDAIGYWQRLHQSLAAVLRTHAEARDPDGVRSRHDLAGRWHEEHRLFPEAIAHYVDGGSLRDAARVVGHVYPQFMNISYQGAAVGRWLAMLPPHEISASVSLGLASAGVAGLRGEHTEMERWLGSAEILASTRRPVERKRTGATVDFMRGCFHFGEVESALPAARSAWSDCDNDDLWFPMQGAALALLCLWVDGPGDEALGLAEDVLACPEAERHPIAEVGMWALKGVVLATRADPSAMSATQRAAQMRSEYCIDRIPQAVTTWSSTARAYRLMGNVDAAAADALAGYQIVANIPPERDAVGATVPVLIELAHARRLQGRTGEARELIEQARRRLAIVTGPGLLPAMLREAQGDLFG